MEEFTSSHAKQRSVAQTGTQCHVWLRMKLCLFGRHAHARAYINIFSSTLPSNHPKNEEVDPYYDST